MTKYYQMKCLFLLPLASLIAGCGPMMYNSNAEAYMRTQAPSAWGDPPPDVHQVVERKFILSRLKDPNSAIIEFGSPQRVVIPSEPFSSSVTQVWESPAYVNAKNSFGGYAGQKKWSTYYFNGHLYAVQVESQPITYVKQ